MVLRGLFLLIGIAAVSALGAEVVINTPGYYRGVVADRLVINASGVWLEDVTVRGGGYREVPLPQTMTAYRVKPAVGCLVVAGRNVTITNLRLDCAAGLLIFNSSGVVVRGFEARGPVEMAVYKRGLGIYVYNSTDVRVEGGSLYGFHDCVYVEYSRNVFLDGLRAQGCRYGVHVMFSEGVSIKNSMVSDSYVGFAVMYTKNASVVNASAVGNRAWAEGYGILLAELSGVVRGCKAVDNVHGIYVLYWGGTRVLVEGCVISGNYFGITLRGRNATGVEFVGNVIRGNVVEVDHMGVGEEAPAALFRGNLWGGHASPSPYYYASAFSDLMTATEGALAYLAASPARFVIDAAMGRPIAYDPAPRPDERAPPYLLLLALLLVPLVWKSR